MKTTKEDSFLHSHLTKVSRKLGGAVYLFDLSKLYNPSAVKFPYFQPEIIPIFTICKMNPESTDLSLHVVNVKARKALLECTLLWNSYVLDSENPELKNPYSIPKDEPLGSCGQPIRDMARWVLILISTLKSIRTVDFDQFVLLLD